MSNDQAVQIPDSAQLAAHITGLVTPEKIVAVAIAGPPGSGKSTLAADLARRRNHPVRPKGFKTGWQFYRGNSFNKVTVLTGCHF